MSCIIKNTGISIIAAWMPAITKVVAICAYRSFLLGISCRLESDDK